MKRVKRRERHPFFAILFKAGVLLGIVLTVSCFTGPACADDGINITCYKDARSSFSVGRVVVFDAAEAAPACNSMYYDCRGRCIGCYHDFDYVDNVCVDMQGNTFLK